jgi:pSer/pThr/pTyr-binding forkhead associated (FHA) protein
VFCTQCGQGLPAAARFCPACGRGVDTDVPVTEPADVEAATGSIDTGEVEAVVGVDVVPELPAGTALLAVVRGPNAGSRYLLDRDSTSIGRHPDSHVFLDDVTVSRHHARLDREDEGFVLYDLGSLNGTYLAGERVDRRLLRAGAELQVGRFKLLFVSATS